MKADVVEVPHRSPCNAEAGGRWVDAMQKADARGHELRDPPGAAAELEAFRLGEIAEREDREESGECAIGIG